MLNRPLQPIALLAAVLLLTATGCGLKVSTTPERSPYVGPRPDTGDYGTVRIGRLAGCSDDILGFR